MVQHNQYRGLAHEDPNVHLAAFLEIVDTVKMNGVTEDVIQMRLFLFSLRDKARGWLQSLQPGSIGPWEELGQNFLTKFFPPSKTSQLRGEIASLDRWILSLCIRYGKDVRISFRDVHSTGTRIGSRFSCSIMG